MFGNNNGKDTKGKSSDSGRSSTPAGGGGVNTIDAKTTIEGNLKAGGDIRIDGTLIGNLICEAKLIIGPKGNIEGDVECAQATIEGTFKGNLIVREELTLQATAKVTGDVKAKKMAVLGGSQINGTCTVPYSGGGGKMSAGNPLKKQQGANA
ncbi:bactofilin family protein [Neolewinella agarilytica]|uniref:Protein CcmA, bactofilin family n=1 Tax=Neolewinella agarilytica TaxID=478744 RepID=A0A1H9J767_9BACT|nr:polymer-forming cytoskeletal protein [Neolewinella agarilytica]SEQ82579.1 protein CcmA, bactofilin family [Neolewinella agarilytica]